MAFREAFDGFEPQVIARYTARDVERLLADPGIVRHRGKITATIANAIAVGAMHGAGTSLKQIVWSHAPLSRGSSLADQEQIPSETPESKALAGTLRRWGMRYVGATTTYAFMQSQGSWTTPRRLPPGRHRRQEGARGARSSAAVPSR